MTTAAEKTAWAKEDAKAAAEAAAHHEATKHHEAEVKKADDVKLAEAAKPIAKAKVTIIDHVADNEKHEWFYPLADMKSGQAFFVANEPNSTWQTANKVNREVAIANDYYSEIETDENGDEVWEDVYIRTTKRHADGTVQLDSGGRPIVGHDPIARPNLIYGRHYVVRQISKDDLVAGKNAESDGVLVVRVY